MSWTVAVLSSLLCVGLGACGGSSGGGGDTTFDAFATLVDVRFPDPNDANVEPEDQAPQRAPLNQSIELVFSGRPDPSQVGSSTVAIRDALGFPVAGTYEVEGTVVRFTPALPTGAIDSTSTDLETLAGNAGLRPGARYTLVLDRDTWSFVAAVAVGVTARFGTGKTGQISLAFQTTTAARDLFRGAAARSPTRIATTPADGSTGISPQLYTDPDGRFDSRGAFTLRFDGPLHPGDVDLAGFQLVDLEDPAFPAGLSLGVDVTVLSNTPDGSTVSVQATGILPLGHMVCVEHPTRVRGLGQRSPVPGPTSVAAAFTIADAPPGTVVDVLEEDFDSTAQRSQDPADLPPGERAAEWDRFNSNVLIAAPVFEGDGLLGRFVPPPPPNGSTRTVILDTSRQVFPLFDGSTPDAPTGYEVIGGRFAFTDIDIPAGVIVQIRGPNPLVITATGNVHIAGEIHLQGQPGGSDNSFDSAMLSLPGGAPGSGGGRGGVAHPILFWPPGQIVAGGMVSPPAGGAGYGPTGLQDGGQGGESGMLDDPDGNGDYQTDQEISCMELNGNGNGDFAAGGSGGGMRRNGKLGRNGRGNVRPDAMGGWVLRTPDDGPDFNVLQPGARGERYFTDADGDNNFFGERGEIKDAQGGQGGGGGGSRTEAYYCGSWCMKDADPANDSMCMGGEGMLGTRWGDSAGDARGGGGGGGGGALLLQTLGSVEVAGTGVITAQGGRGGGGEVLGGSGWGGPGGAGAGGAILLQAAGGITLRNNSTLDVRGGLSNTSPLGDGSEGQIQLQVPPKQTPTVEPNARLLPPKSYFDPSNTLAPAEFTQFSSATSDWFDLGRTTQRAPAGVPPVFRFRGLDASGRVITDLAGNVVNPSQTDIRCDYLGQADPLRPGEYLPGQSPRSDFIPPNAAIRVEFQTAQPVAPGSSEVDPGTITPWAPAVSVADGQQFVRYRVTFDLAVNGDPLTPSLPRPAVQGVWIRAEF